MVNIEETIPIAPIGPKPAVLVSWLKRRIKSEIETVEPEKVLELKNEMLKEMEEVKKGFPYMVKIPELYGAKNAELASLLGTYEYSRSHA